MNEVRYEIRYKIRELRRRHQIGHRRIAQSLGVSQSTVAKWGAGLRQPRDADRVVRVLDDMLSAGGLATV